MDMDLEKYLQVKKSASVDIGGEEGSFDIQEGIDIGKLSSDIKAPHSVDENLTIASALCGYCMKIFESYGTDASYVKSHNIDSQQSHQIMHLLKLVCVKLKIEFEPDFNDFDSFYVYWKRKGAAGQGGYAKRRKMVDDQFSGLQNRIEDLQVEREASASSLARPITPAKNIGWPAVDREIEHLRNDFAEAKDTMDYSNIGNDAVAVLERLSDVVYSIADMEGLITESDRKSLGKGETKNRLCFFAEKKISEDNKNLQQLCRGAIGFAHGDKHNRMTDRKKAGIAADTAILVANILRRLYDD